MNILSTYLLTKYYIQVWADWKTKTKKKALAKHQEASGTSHGPSSRIQITDPELRVLVILGMAAVVGQDGIGERRFNVSNNYICL